MSFIANNTEFSGEKARWSRDEVTVKARRHLPAGPVPNTASTGLGNPIIDGLRVLHPTIGGLQHYARDLQTAPRPHMVASAKVSVSAYILTS